MELGLTSEPVAIHETVTLFLSYHRILLRLCSALQVVVYLVLSCFRHMENGRQGLEGILDQGWLDRIVSTLITVSAY